jgi:hypothetical protein
MSDVQDGEDIPQPDRSRAARGQFREPPVEHQFKPGTSGNPRGRPKKTKVPTTQSVGLMDQPTVAMLLQEAHRPVMIRENGRVVSLPVIQAVFRMIGLNAMKGDRFAQKHFLDLVRSVEEKDLKERTEQLQGAVEYKSGWSQLIEYEKANGLPASNPLPHPDDIILDAKGGFYFAGPITSEEKRDYDEGASHLKKIQAEVTFESEKYQSARGSKDKASRLERWHWLQGMFDGLNDNLPPRYQMTLENRSFSPGATRPGDRMRGDLPWQSSGEFNWKVRKPPGPQ